MSKVRKIKALTPPPNKDSIVFEQQFKPRTKNQAIAIRTMLENDITIVHGVAGSGKSYLALGLALEHLRDGKIDKLIIVRPTVEASPKGIGYIPGAIDEKMAPYCLPLFETIKGFIGKDKFEYFMQRGRIEVAPLEYMRGRNFKDCYVIADECQNCTLEQLKMLMTRLCEHAKIFILGDTDQSDLGYSKFTSGLSKCIELLQDRIDGFGVCFLGKEDIQRNRIVGEILEVFSQHSL